MKKLGWFEWVWFAKPWEVVACIATCGICYLIWPSTTPWIAISLVLFVPPIWEVRAGLAAQINLASERLSVFNGRQSAAYVAFVIELGDTGCDAKEVSLIYEAVQDHVSPPDGPKLPIFVNDKLLEIAFDEDDISMDLVSHLIATLPRDFKAWNDTEEVSKIETAGQLVHLIGSFPKA